MISLSKLLNEVDVPEYFRLINNPESILRCAKAVYGCDAGEYEGRTLCNSHVWKYSFTRCPPIYVKWDEDGAANSAAQILLDNILTGRNYRFATAHMSSDYPVLITEDVGGICLDTLGDEQIQQLVASDAYSFASGAWAERVKLLRLNDRKPRNVLWTCSSLKDIDYGFMWGRILDCYDSLEDGPLNIDCWSADQARRGRAVMQEKIAANLQANTSHLLEFLATYDYAIPQHAGVPRRILSYYASNYAPAPLGKLIHATIDRSVREFVMRSNKTRS